MHDLKYQAFNEMAICMEFAMVISWPLFNRFSRGSLSIRGDGVCMKKAMYSPKPVRLVNGAFPFDNHLPYLA